jgi:hypothetical protein
MDAEPLVCPQCARSYPVSERFCEDCGMPLVRQAGGEAQASERQRTVRKIKPQYTEGKLVKVARAANQPQAEFLAGMLLEEGIPCMLRRSPGFDVAEFLVAGPRDLLVPESAAEAAREALAYEGRTPANDGPAG